MSRTGIEPRPPQCMGGEHSSKELFEQLYNSYLEHLHLSPQHSLPVHMVTWTCVHEHTWAALGCRPNSTCKLFNPEYWHQARTCKSTYSLSSKTDHAGVTTMERFYQGHLHPKLGVPRLTCLGGNQTQVSAVGGEHSSKELFKRSNHSYSEHLHISPWQYITFHYLDARVNWNFLYSTFPRLIILQNKLNLKLRWVMVLNSPPPLPQIYFEKKRRQ